MRGHVRTPLGTFSVLLDDAHRLARIGIADEPLWLDRFEAPAAAVKAALAQLAEYAAGERLTFDLPLAAIGTPFQQRVWAALCGIPFGQTFSYAQLAAAIGQPSAARAVGAANGQNPLAIVVPCHRVIGASGQLVGYAGGLAFKRRLLDHEAAVMSRRGLFAHALA